MFLWLVISLFKWTSKRSFELLACVPKCKKTVICLMKEISVLHKLHSGISYNAVGSEFNVNGSTICIK